CCRNVSPMRSKSLRCLVFCCVWHKSTPPFGNVLAAVCQSAFIPNRLAGTMAILSSRALRIACGGFAIRYRYPLFCLYLIIYLCLGPNPTFVSLGAIRRKNKQMKELSDDLFHM